MKGLKDSILSNIFFFSIFILLSGVTSGVVVGSSFGGPNDDFSYIDSQSYFNADLLTSTKVFRGVSDPSGSLLSFDLDGDGSKEIIGITKNVMNIWSGPQLSFESSYTLGEAIADGDYYSNIEIYDISGDFNKEIIVHSQINRSIFILNYSASQGLGLVHYFHRIGYIDTGTPAFSSDSIIGCGQYEGCLLVYDDDTEASAPNFLYARGFNSTHVSSEVTLKTTGSTIPYCLPKSGYVVYDGSYWFTSHRAGEDIRLWEVSLNSSLHPSGTDNQLSETILADGNCGRGVDTFTSPVITDALTDPGNEIIFGYMVDEDSFRLASFDSTGSFIDKYPGSETSEGRIISNPFIGHVTADGISSGFNDVCVAGYDHVARLIVVDCFGYGANIPNIGNLFLLDNIEFSYDMDIDDFNLSEGADFMNMNTWMIEADPSNQYNEILTPYGVFSLEDYTDGDANCEGFGNCDMYLIFRSQISYDNSVSFDDVIGEGFPSMFGFTTSAIYLVTDGNQNEEPAFDGYYQIDPCISQPIQVNSSMQISFTAVDPDSDLVNVSFEVYDGTIYEQNSTVETLSGALAISDFFVLNQTISNGYIVVKVTDGKHQSPTFIEGLNKITKQFTVSSTGVIYNGGCVTSGDIDNEGSVVVGGSCLLDSDCGDGNYCDSLGVCQSIEPTSAEKEGIRDAIAPPELIAPEFRFLYGIGLIVLAMVLVGSFLAKQHIHDPRVWLFAVGGTGFGLYLLAAFIQMVPAWPVFVMLVFSAAVLGLRFTPLGRGSD